MPRLAVVVAIVVGSLGAGCSEQAEPPRFNDQTRERVMLACRDEADRPLVADVCACTYRSMRSGLSYERFTEIDQQLREQPGAPLPAELVEAMAGCVIEVADL